ncbi:hypothetical protein [Mangrovibacterium lignilyticum]|uniref:hypothetical protein n=1 Tax=Mangrovibacterium lignilyticum TaxID=2668052 RepID=UPI0013D0B56F|nr:hypothetical protein [Mangrovibacterium lignilyticum]
MKSKVTLPFLLIAGVLLFQSCTGPGKITKLIPEKEPDKWLYGQALLTDSIYGISYEIGFDRYQDGAYWFDFHIINHSNMSLLVDPVQYTCQAFDELMNPKTTQPVNAIDPEGKILQFDKGIAQNEAVAKNELGIVIMGIGASIAANAIIGTGNPRNDNIRYAVTDGIMATSYAIGDEARFEAQNLNELKDAWEHGTIRKTTLESNFAMFGKVFFPASPDATYLKIVIPVDDKNLEFDYKQVLFPVN